jgi:predicted phage terminase large subunit-like protein
LLKEIIADPATVVTRGRTYDNAANLSPIFLASIRRRYEGTRLGRQELEGEVLEDVQGALWSRANIDKLRVAAAPEFTRIVIAIDPAVSSGEDSDETGIIVAGLGVDGEGYILEDASDRYTPTEWASKAVVLYHKYEADRVIAETNQGGAMVESTLRVVDPNIPYRGIHASRGKIVRAEPVSALYEQGRAHHVGAFPELEDQLCTFTPGSTKSPDRLDAAVYALTELMVSASDGTAIIEYYRLLNEAEGRNTSPHSSSLGKLEAPETFVTLKPPDGISTVYGLLGNSYSADADGLMTVTIEDAKPLKAGGFTEVEKEDADVQ